MSYQVLARKWRPKTFREMVGQEHVLKALINALDHDRLHHAYLFTGTRGVGKTTIARVLAKCLNCEAGVSSEPCGQCSACNAINEGRFVDLIEVDAASRTKVEDTRELLENVQYAPTVGRYKVYLIDEVHMLSGHSFNALLKTLEEPPPHVKFLLATTDPQKLPATILSRCLQFHLKNMTAERIVGHLQYVLEQEMVSFDVPALWLLGRAAAGSMRDALSLTDQAIAFGAGKLTENDVRAMLGDIDQSAIEPILTALIASDGPALLQGVQLLSEHTPDYVATLDALVGLLHRIAIAQVVPDALDNSSGDREQLVAYAAQLTAEELQLYYQLCLNGRRDLSLLADPRSGFEMLLLRLLAFKPAGVTEPPSRPLIHSSDGAVEASASIKKPEPAGALAVNSATKPTPNTEQVELAAVALPAPERHAEVVLKTPTNSAVPKRTDEILPRTDGGDLPVIGQSVDDVATQSLSLNQLTPNTWAELFERMGFAGVVGSIAAHCQLLAVDGMHLSLRLDRNNATLFNDGYGTRIEQQLAKVFAAPVQIRIEVGETDCETPAARRQRIGIERRQQAFDAFVGDPNVQQLTSAFAAELDRDSVIPLD